jgi:hypothetical protein
MRSTFCVILLLNDASQKHDTSCILNGKEWGVGKTERQRERVRGKVWVRKDCSVCHELVHWPSIYEGLEKG